MNIALPNAASGPSPIAPATSGAAPIALAVDAGGAASPADGTSSVPTFGTTFNKHLTEAADDKTLTRAIAKGAKIDPNVPIDTVTPGNPAGGDAKTAAASGNGASRRDKTDEHKDGAPVDSTADGSAAQLAVISQWLDVAKPVATTDAQALVASSTAVRTGPDLKGATNATNATRGRTSQEGTAASAAERAASVETAGTPPSTAATTSDTLARTENDLALAALAGTAAPDAGSMPAPTTHANLAADSLFGTRMTTPTPTPGAPATPTTLHEPVGTSAWSREVGQVALRMATTDLQSASLRLNPEHLGPLDVEVRVDKGVTHVAFNAVHADTRQALEASRTTLDQMFTSQGIKMGEVSVGGGSTDGRNAQADAAQTDASRRDSGSSGSSSNRWNGGDVAGDDADSGTTITTRVIRAVGLVDTFA
jgi:flagellar hook-length control protein FliK